MRTEHDEGHQIIAVQGRVHPAHMSAQGVADHVELHFVQANTIYKLKISGMRKTSFIGPPTHEVPRHFPTLFDTDRH